MTIDSHCSSPTPQAETSNGKQGEGGGFRDNGDHESIKRSPVNDSTPGSLNVMFRSSVAALATNEIDAGVRSTRHPYITRMVRVLPVNQVMVLAGHSNIKTTMRYVHSLPEDNAAVVAALAVSGLGAVGAQSGHIAADMNEKTA